LNPKAVQPAPFAEPLSFPLSSGWVAFFQGLFAGAQPQGGPTAKRPTEPVQFQYYFDTNLGKPIFCKTAKPVVWVDAAGTTV
jgi:hypothetical protein